MKDVYILAAKQISTQPPLTDEWMDHPLSYTEQDVRAIDPDYKQYFAPNVARRLDKILKRALLLSRQVIETSGISNPEAIITGTGLGCIENTELFLEALIREGEELLKPTYFMQSTHNTIGSLIAIDAHCHGYNSTYTHKGISFECALSDAFMQLSGGQIATAMVGAYDEMTSNYFTILSRTGYLGHFTSGFSGETAVSFMLSTHPSAGALCRLRGLETCYCSKPNTQSIKTTLDQLLTNNPCAIDAVMIGTNGRDTNDRIYSEICPKLFPGKPLLRYKHLFGESYTTPGLGIYAAAICLHQNRIPSHLSIHPEGGTPQHVKNILFYNQFENKNHTFTLLSSCGEESC
jgi:hypothetical protein